MGMETANILLSLGGDDGNTVMKWGVTAAEIAVLRSIHGEAAVNDIDPVGTVERSHRQERERLVGIYGRAKFADDKPVVDSLFPGIAARVFERLDELDLDTSFFKPLSRAKPAEAKQYQEQPQENAAPPPAPPAKKLTAAEAKKAAAAAKKAAEAAKAQPPITQDEPEDEEAEDGIDEINDGQGVLD